MFEHRVAGESAKLARDTQHHWLRIDALKLDLAFAEIGFDPRESPEKIVVPEGAAEFTVGDRPKAGIFLSADDCRDRAVFSLFKFGRRDLVFLALRARFFQRRCAQETSHMIGAVGGSCAFGHLYLDVIFVRRPGRASARPGTHTPQSIERARRMGPRFRGDDRINHFPQTSSASSTIIRSFAHCSSSARTLPSSVEAKPHCGERHSWSSETNLAACSIRRLISSFDSSRPLFVVTRPSTTTLSFGSIRNGSKPPARSVSYSMKKPCTLILLNRISCTAS